MGQQRISSVLISMLILGLLVVGMMVFFSNINSNFTNTNYNQTELEKYNKLNDISNLTESTQSEVTNISVSTGITDILGGIFTSAYKAAKITATSIDTIDDIRSNAMQDASIGNPTIISNVNTTLGAILIVIIFISILLYIVFKVSV